MPSHDLFVRSARRQRCCRRRAADWRGDYSAGLQPGVAGRHERPALYSSRRQPEHRDDQRIGSAFIWLDGGQLRVRQIQLEESEGNASVSEQTRQQLIGLANAPFSEALTIPLTDSAQLDLSLRQLLLQLVVKREALAPSCARAAKISVSPASTLSAAT